MTIGNITLGDVFFVGITDDNLDHHVDENSQQIMSENLSGAASVMMNDSTEHESRGTIYICVPVGRVEQQGKLLLDTQFEVLTRAAAAVGRTLLQNRGGEHATRGPTHTVRGV